MPRNVHGTGWLAYQPTDHPGPEEPAVLGPIRVRGRDGVPLWTRAGSLPAEAAALAETVGVDRELAEELVAWAAENDATSGRRPDDVSRWRARGRTLSGRLRHAVTSEVVDDF